MMEVEWAQTRDIIMTMGSHALLHAYCLYI